MAPKKDLLFKILESAASWSTWSRIKINSQFAIDCISDYGLYMNTLPVSEDSEVPDVAIGATEIVPIGWELPHKVAHHPSAVSQIQCEGSHRETNVVTELTAFLALTPLSQDWHRLYIKVTVISPVVTRDEQLFNVELDLRVPTGWIIQQLPIQDATATSRYLGSVNYLFTSLVKGIVTSAEAQFDVTIKWSTAVKDKLKWPVSIEVVCDYFMSTLGVLVAGTEPALDSERVLPEAWLRAINTTLTDSDTAECEQPKDEGVSAEERWELL